MTSTNARLLAMLLCYCLVFTTTRAALGQSTSGQVRGRVFDSETRLPVAMAKITITHEVNGSIRASRTDSAGDFFFPFLVPGYYRIDCKKEGYQSQSVARLEIKLNELNSIPPTYLRTERQFVFIPTDLPPPKIQIDSPSISPNVEMRFSTSTVTIRGQAISAAKISFVIVQGTPVELDEKGSFSTELQLTEGRNRITITALDVYRNWAKVDFTVFRENDGRGLVVSQPKTLAETLRSKQYFALVIGNDDYQYVQPLRTAVADARAVASILREEYGFSTRLLLNATREEIVAALNEYRRKLDASAELLVYYAGHGYYDREVEKAYWLPVDARTEDNVYWISADDVTSYIKPVQARHILVISDSCYSGLLARGEEPKAASSAERERYLQKMLEGKSRRLIASGGNEPVDDGGGGDHSVFASALLRGLTQMKRDMFTAGELFYEFIEERVAGKSQQTPQYSALRNSGHDSGDFVFFRKPR
jgi:hypothetical protein